METVEIDARGYTFTALTDGPSDGPLLLLLHGLPRTSWEWHHQIPAFAAAGYRVVAQDMRGYCPGARPEGVEAYTVHEFVQDALAIVDESGHAGRPFDLMGTSIGATIAWQLAADHPDRVGSLATVNIPHHNAVAEALLSGASDQAQRFEYIGNAQDAVDDRDSQNKMLEHQGLPDDETAPYREALASQEAVETVYHWYRAMPLWIGPQLPSVPAPTMFIWPPAAANISREAAEANAKYVTGPYRFEMVDGSRQPILQSAPEAMTELLLEHLAAHGARSRRPI
jgi:pimeloyl-ACP methyl ester carboxylesterase